jgi:hypothetical protein
MSKISIFFGLLLVTLGLAFYVATGSESPTALIPLIPGVLIGVSGAVAFVPKYRKHAAHGGALVGLLGFIASAGRLAMVIRKEEVPVVATVEMFLMAAICILYVGFCVKSFIAARKAMKAEAAASDQPDV